MIFRFHENWKSLADTSIPEIGCSSPLQCIEIFLLNFCPWQSCVWSPVLGEIHDCSSLCLSLIFCWRGSRIIIFTSQVVKHIDVTIFIEALFGNYQSLFYSPVRELKCKKKITWNISLFELRRNVVLFISEDCLYLLSSHEPLSRWISIDQAFNRAMV